MSGNHYPPSQPFRSSGQPGGDPFAPEVVEEQIAVRLGASGLQPRPDAETRLVRALTDLYPPPPHADAVLARVRQRVQAEHAPLNTNRSSANTRPAHASTRPGQRDSRSHSTGGTPPPTRGRGILASVAAVIVVVLLVGAFARLLSTRGPASSTPKSTPVASPSAPAPTGTATSQPTVAPGTGWTPLPGFSTQARMPAIAPTDSKTGYIFTFPTVSCKGCAQPQPLLERTQDAGATWQPMTMPTPLVGVNYANGALIALPVQISPFDAHLIFVSVYNGLDHSCPSQATAGGCFSTFRSADAGQTWQQLSLPAPGAFESGVFAGVPGSGNRFYTLVDTMAPASSGTYPAARLLATSDAGQTWQLADAPLAAKGQGIDAYGVSQFRGANGDNVYAITEPAGQAGETFNPTYQLWTSHDSGTTWTQATLPVRYPRGLAADAFPDHTALVLFGADTADINSTPTFYASTDDGAHWTHAPTAGIPTGTTIVAGPLAVFGNAVLALTANGSILSWQPGAAQWTFIAPAPSASDVRADYSVTLTQEGAQSVLVAIYITSQGSRAASFLP